jgi:hypothetical protein
VYPEGSSYPGPVVSTSPGYGSVPGFQPVSAPPKRSFPLALTVSCIVLALGVVITNVVVLAVLGGLHGSIGKLKAQQAQRRAADAVAQKKQLDDFQQADLPGKLAKVRALTTAAGQALIVWVAEPVGQKLLSPVQNAVNKCDLAIFDYDATAARFPPGMLAGLPIAIDTSDSATNCTRIA